MGGHQKCIADWIKQDKTCPICQHDIQPAKGHPNLLADQSVMLLFDLGVIIGEEREEFEKRRKELYPERPPLARVLTINSPAKTRIKNSPARGAFNSSSSSSSSSAPTQATSSPSSSSSSSSAVGDTTLPTLPPPPPRQPSRFPQEVLLIDEDEDEVSVLPTPPSNHRSSASAEVSFFVCCKK
jgi:hypothetical protein